MNQLNRNQLNNTITNTTNSAPLITDDVSLGYAIGSLWYDTSTSPVTEYVCEDASVGAAVWSLVGDGAGTGVQSVSDGTGVDVDNTDPLNPIIDLDAATLVSLGLANSAAQSGDNVSIFANDAGYITAIPNTVPVWIKVTKSFTDYSDPGNNKTITIYTPGANEVITKIAMYISTAFNGGAITAYTLNIEFGGTVFIAAENAFTPALGNEGFNAQSASQVLGNPDAGARTVTSEAVSTTDTLNNAVQGSVTFYLLVSTQP